MSQFKKLTEQMRADWDRRIRHDYRFWMSDGHRDDSAMWESGKRDLSLLIKGIENTQSLTALDLGCGVGRLVKAATSRFSKVIGLDVSSVAIDKVRELVGTSTQLELHLGDGNTLQPLQNNSVDLVFSFAALCSIPSQIVASYLAEMHRVLKPSGTARLQLYLGKEQLVAKGDTLHLRCYDRERFTTAVTLAGFSVEFIEELILPFQVSFKEIGIEAVIVSLKREARAAASADQIAQALLPGAEPEQLDEGAERDLEYWMSINYAKDLAEKGDLEKAQEALQYAATVSNTATIDVRDLLDKIITRIDKSPEEPRAIEIPAEATAVVTNDYLMNNVAALTKRFPELAMKVAQYNQTLNELSIDSSSDGAILTFRGQFLDHPSKPRAGADAWVKRTMQEDRIEKARELVVVGFGTGYHLESLVQLTNKQVSVVEPELGIFVAALRSRDLTQILSTLKSITIGEESTPDFSDGAELIVRPQTQALYSDYCAQLRSAFYGVRGLTDLHPTIGVLGPLQGGTLPITAYTLRALAENKQRVREYDTSGFAPGFHYTSKFLYDKFRLSAVQNTYIEMVSHVVLESINEKPVDILICMAQAPMTARFLTELKKKGVVLVLWFMEDYLRFTYWKEFARYFDFVFTMQKGDCIEAIKQAGAGEVHYLPAACDPFIHTPQTLTAEERARWGSPISFVGAGYHNRQQMFASLADLPFKIWGTEWPSCRPFDRLVQEEGRRLTPTEYVKIFNATDVNINLHSSTERDGVEPNGDFVNPRTFELAAAGAFQLVDERTLLPEMFVPGKEVITFKDTQDLKEKMNYYLAHPAKRAEVISAARARVLKEHTYVHRMRQMLSIIYNSQFESLKRKEQGSPWMRMLARTKGTTELEDRCKRAWERGEEATLDGLLADIVSGAGKLSETEQKLLFLYHVRKQIVRMKIEELGDKAPGNARQV